MSIYINSKKGTDFWFDMTKEKELAKISGNSLKSSVQLAKLSNAMSNFATIINNRTVPCNIATNSGHSFTDGKSIKVSADIRLPSKYNIACGLVLHEASHIKLTDFKLLSDLSSEFRADIDNLLMHNSLGYDEKTKIVELLWSSSYLTSVWMNTFKSIINVIEDRRIDRYMVNENKGYLEYYKALYDEYFNSPFIEKCFKSRQMTKSKTFDDLIKSYMFYIINIHSEFFTSKHYGDLPHLETIVKLIDVANIDRLKNTNEVKEISLKILLEIILGILEKIDSKTKEDKEEDKNEGDKPNKSGKDSDSSKGNKSDKSESESTNNSEDKEDTTEENGDENSISTEDTVTDEDVKEEGKGDTNSTKESEGEETSKTHTTENTTKDSESNVELTAKDIQEIGDMLAKQQDFIDHKIEKTVVSDMTAKKIETYATENVDLKETDIPNVEVLTVINPTDSQFIDTTINPFFSRDCSNVTYYTSSVSDGIQMGKVLGKKIKTRVESNELITNHIRSGKLDKRRIAAAGYGIEDVFTEKSIFTYSPATIHFTIDASGSMGGSKWSSTIKLVSAIGQAFSEISNITFKVSLRGTSRGGELPVIIQFFDSSKMKYRKLFDRLAKIGPSGTTPEGICFSAIMDKLVKGSTIVDSYLINISDGEPGFSTKSINYSGYFAANHTAKQWEMIKKRGIKTLSYFISSYMTGPSYRNNIFNTCYGKDASYIDTTSITEIAKTLNTLLISKK